MGAKAIELDLETLEGAGGYAREMTEERAQRQMELLTPYIEAADALITTAAVPGRRAPMLVTREMVEQMKPGSVVVDLAAESGGNVEGVVAGQEFRVGGATLVGLRDAASALPVDASRLYAKNVANLLALLVDDDGGLRVDLTDEVLAGACVTHDGEVRHEAARKLLGEDG
jgi:NAD(P) transhydrogenase subunit alpha